MITDYFKEIEKLNKPDAALPVTIVEETDVVGWLATNADCSIVASAKQDANDGFVNFYKKTNLGYDKFAKLDSRTFFGASVGFAYGFAYCEQYDYWIVGTHWMDATYTDEGKAHILDVSEDGTITKLQELRSSDGGNTAVASGGYGVRLAVSHDGNWLYVGQYQKTTANRRGAVFAYKLTGDRSRPAIYNDHIDGTVTDAKLGSCMGCAQTSNTVVLGSYSEQKLRFYTQTESGLVYNYDLDIPVNNKFPVHLTVQFSPDDSFFLLTRDDGVGFTVCRLNPVSNKYEVSEEIFNAVSTIAPMFVGDKMITKSTSGSDVNIKVLNRTNGVETLTFLNSTVADAEANRYGSVFYVSPDESVVVIGAYRANANRGWAEIWLRVGDTGYDYERVFANECGTNDTEGYAGISASYDERTKLVAIGVIWSNTAGTDAGRVGVYRINDDRTVSHLQWCLPSAGQGGMGYGGEVFFSADSKWLFITQNNRTTPAGIHAGGFYACPIDLTKPAPIQVGQQIAGTVASTFLGFAGNCMNTENVVALLSSNPQYVNTIHFYKLNSETNLWELDYNLPITTYGWSPQIIYKLRFSYDDSFFDIKDEYNILRFTRKADGKYEYSGYANDSAPRSDATPIHTANSIWYTRPPYSGVVRRGFDSKEVVVGIPAVNTSAVGKTIQTITADNELQLVNDYTPKRLVDTQLISAEHTTLLNTFGFGIEVSGNGQWLAVGAYAEPYDGFANAGYVTLYRRVGNDWVTHQQVASPDLREKAHFGWGLTLNHDGNILVVCENTLSGANMVSYYNIFHLIDDEWVPVWRDKAPNPNPGAVIDLPYAYDAAITNDGGMLFISSQYNHVAILVPDGNGGYCRTDKNKLLRNPTGGVQRLHGNVACSKNGELVVVGHALNLDGSSMNRYECASLFIMNKETGVYDYSGFFHADAAMVFPGSGVAISGNGKVVCIGGQGSNNRQGSFAIYTLDETTTTWHQRKHIYAAGSAVNDQVGRCVSLNYDGSEIYVGSHSGKIWRYGVTCDLAEVGLTENIDKYLYLEDVIYKPNIIDANFNDRTVKYSRKGDILFLADTSLSDLYIYKKVDNQWVFNSLIEGKQNFNNLGKFGYSIAFGKDDRYFWATSPTNGRGELRKYVMNEGLPNGVDYYVAPHMPGTDAIAFGAGLDLDTERNLLFVGSSNYSSYQGAVAIYDEKTVTFKYPLLLSTFRGKVTNEHFGHQIAVLNDGTVLIQAANSVYGPNNSHGILHIYRYDASVNNYVFKGVIKPPKFIDGGNFGYSMEPRKDGNGVIVHQVLGKGNNGRMTVALHKYAEVDGKYFLEETLEVFANIFGFSMSEDEITFMEEGGLHFAKTYKLTGDKGVTARLGNKAPFSAIEDALVSEPAIPISL